MTTTVCCYCGTAAIAGASECSGCGASLGLQWDLLPVGYKLSSDKYQIERVLGRGGFGVTYRAIDTLLSRPVAIKEFYPQHCARRNRETYAIEAGASERENYERALSRFKQEGKILAQINHGNVVRVYTLFEELNSAYLVMELLDGHSLASELESREGKVLSERLVKRIVHYIVDALSCTHKQGIYHLDIKPDNILVTRDGRIVLVDFGAARWLDVGSGGQHSQTIAAYTPEYAPLELLNGGKVGAETDIYEVAALCYELLTGDRPPPAWERLGNGWEPKGLAEPWQGLLLEGLALAIEERPGDIRDWWYRGMGLDQPRVTRPVNRWKLQMRDLYHRWRLRRGVTRWLVLSGGLLGLLLCSYGGWIIFTENNVQFRKRWAEQAVAQSRWPEALRHYNRAIQMEPSGELFEGRGDVRMRLLDFAGAVLDYQEALRLQGQAPGELQSKLGRAYLSLGDQLRGQGDFAQAIVNYKEALRVHPPLREVAELQIQQSQFGRAVERYQSKDYKTSIQLHEELLRGKLSNDFAQQVRNSLAQVFLDYGQELTEEKAFSEALDIFSRGIKLAPTDRELRAELYKYRALKLVRERDYEGAFADYNEAIKIREHPDYYQGRAFVRSQLGDLLNAIADYTRALQMGAEDTLTYVGRGEASLRLKDYRSAVEDLNKALTLDPNHHLALLHRGWALYHLRLYRQSVLDFQKLIELDPTVAEAYEGLGYAKYEVGDRRGSHRDLERAIQLYQEQKRPERIDAILEWRKSKKIE